MTERTKDKVFALAVVALLVGAVLVGFGCEEGSALDSCDPEECRADALASGYAVGILDSECVCHHLNSQNVPGAQCDTVSTACFQQSVMICDDGVWQSDETCEHGCNERLIELPDWDWVVTSAKCI